MTTEVVEIKRELKTNQSPTLEELIGGLAHIWLILKHEEKAKKLQAEIEDLRQQVTKLQEVIDESHKVMDKAGIPEGDLPKRITDLIKEGEGSIPREKNAANYT